MSHSARYSDAALQLTLAPAPQVPIPPSLSSAALYLYNLTRYTATISDLQQTAHFSPISLQLQLSFRAHLAILE